MTAPEGPADLVTLEDLLAFKAGEDIDAERLAGAIGAVRDFCEWHIAPTLTETVTLDGNGQAVLLLPSMHVQSVASVSVLGAEEPVDGYEWSRKGMLRRRRYGLWPYRFQAVELTYTHGYVEVPQVVRTIVLDVAARAAASAPDELPEKVGPFEYGGSQGVALLPHELRQLARYKLGWGA